MPGSAWPSMPMRPCMPPRTTSAGARASAGDHASSAASWRARHLAAAATQLTAGRDLLHTHLAPDPDGAMRGRSEWAPVVTSLPVTRALTNEIARWSRQLAPFTAWLAGLGDAVLPAAHARPGISAAVYDGLASASQWLQVAGTAVLPALHADPVRAADTDLLRAIPSAMVPRRLRPGPAEESVTELCDGITISAARLRAAVRGSPDRARWSPSRHLGRLAMDRPRRRRSPATSASWPCDRSPPGSASLPARRSTAAQLDDAADRMAAMRAAWHASRPELGRPDHREQADARPRS